MIPLVIKNIKYHIKINFWWKIVHFHEIGLKWARDKNDRYTIPSVIWSLGINKSLYPICFSILIYIIL